MNQIQKKKGVLVALAFIAFISLGMPDGLHGVAWPGIRESFDLPIDAIGLLLIFGTAGYMVSSFFNSILLRRFGVGKLLAMSCAATGGTQLMYGLSPLWPLFIAVAFIGGLGAGAIDAGLNTYVARRYSESVMQRLHAFFGIGITIGPVIMTAGIQFFESWRPAYILVAAIQLALAVLFFLSRRQWTDESQQTDEVAEDIPLLRETLRQPSAVLSMLMFFIYTGIELGLGLWSYSLLTESRGVDPAVAGFITAGYWGFFTVGRMLAGFYTHKIRSGTVILLSIAAASAGIFLVALNRGAGLTVAGVAVSAFAIAPIFPAMVSDTINRVGPRHESNTIGMQIACAGLGISLIPSLAGVLARRFSLEIIPLFILIDTIILLLLFLLARHFRPSRQTIPPAKPDRQPRQAEN
ncbi:MAG: MFS transporter [Salinispira sp.]